MSQVQVCVRVRPLNDAEEENEYRNVIKVPPGPPEGQLFITKPTKYLSVAEQQEKIKKREIGSNFQFDRVFDSTNYNSPNHSTQQTVFDYIGRKVVTTAFSAFNCTVFAYGQTGSGKTYTLMGYPEEEERGLVPRTCEHLFQEIQRVNEENPEDTFARFKVEISFLEIYNEKVRDLLLRQPTTSDSQQQQSGTRSRASAAAKQALRVREHPKEGVIVEGLSRHIVNDYDAVEEFLKKGNAVRVSGATHVHEQSSRSHAIFTIHFVQAEMSEDGIPNERVSKINLVDLAGSERADPASDYNRERFKEGININKSLVSLGNVIDSLAEMSSQQQSGSRPNTSASTKNNKGDINQQNIHVPYRESVLTFLLRDSLGGNAFTTMIATISPSSGVYSETMSTLRYASRTQVIKNQPIKNEDPQIKLIKDLKSQVDRLKQMLEQKGGLDGVSQVLEEKMQEGQEQIDSLTEQWTQQWERQKLLLQDSVTHDTTGLTVNSDFPHLVGFPNTSTRSKAFVVYQLCPGSFSIGSGNHEIGISGTPSHQAQGVIKNENGVITLTPNKKSHEFQINSVDISGTSHLYNGCLVQLGKNNLFRFWDPAVLKTRQNTAQTATENEDGVGVGDSDNPLIDSNLTDENAYFAPPPQFSRLKGLDRASSVMSFQSVDMEESLYGGDLGGGLRGRGNFAPSERTQSMASLLSNQEVIQKMALADSLAEQLNEANKQIEDMREQRQHKDAEDEERRIALENLQFDYQEQICEHQEKIEQLLVDNEDMVQKAETEIGYLQQKLDDKRVKEKAKLDAEIEKIDKQMQQVHARKKTAKTTMAKSNLEKEEIEVMGKLRNLREREKKLKESLKATENQIREKEKKVAAKKKKFEEKLQKMESELHTIKAQYLDRHMRTSLANKNSASRDQINHNSQQKLDDLNDENEEMNPEEAEELKLTGLNGHAVPMRSKRGRSNNESNRHAISGLVLPNKSSFSELLERRKRERDAAAAAQMTGGAERNESLEVKGGRPQSKMIDVAIGEDDEGNPMYLKISLRGSRENLEDQEQSSTSHRDQQQHVGRSQGRSIAKERALSMDLADLHKLTNFQELEIREPNQYESGDNLLQMPLEYGRSTMLQRFMDDLGLASVSDVRSNFGQSQEKLPTSNSEINLKIKRHCEAGVHVVSPNSSCETLHLEKPIKAKVVYHESKLRVDNPLHIVQPLNILPGKEKQAERGRKTSDYGSVSSMTRGTSPTTFTSGDSVLGRQANDEKKVLRRVINGPHGFRPVSQDLTAYPAFNGREGGKPRPKSLYSALEFDDENQENEWGFQPLSSAQSGTIRRPFEIKQAEGHTARIGPKVTLTVTPQVTVTAIPGHMLAERPHLVSKPGGDAQSPSGSSKFIKLRREMQDKQRQKPADVSQSSIRSNLQSYSVISSREDLKEANDSHLRRRLYSNQPFLAESAISNDSPGGQEVIADSTEMWANRASRLKRSRPQLHPQAPNSNSSLNQVHHLIASTPGENDLEIAQFGAPQYQPSPLIGQSSPPVDVNTVVRRRVNPNRSNRFEEKRMSWPVNKRDQLTAEMESQPLFILNYQQSEDSISVFPADYTQDSPYDPVIIEDYGPADHARQFEVANPNANSRDVIVNNPPKIHYNNDRSFTDSRGDTATGTGTGTETEPYEENPYSMGIYIETKGLDGDDGNPPVNQFRKIEPEHFRFPSVSKPGMDQDVLDLNRSQGGSNYNLSRATSDVFSNFSGRNLISESSGTYRHIEEVFTTESIITKGNEKKTKAGKILGKWKLIRKKEKRAQEQEKFLSTLETPVNQNGSGKKIKFDKSLSASATSIGSVKKLRNQASSPIEFDKTKKRKNVSYLTVMHDREMSFTRLNRTDLEQSPKTPSSNISTQTACEASTQTDNSPTRMGKSFEYLFGSRRRTSRISRKSRHRRKGKHLQSEGTQAGVYSSGSDDISRTSSSYSGSSSSEGKKSKKGKYSRYSGRHGHGNKYGKKTRRYGSKRHNRDSVTSSTSKSSNDDSKKVKKSPNKRLKDAMTNTVNEIGIQTEAESQAVATNTEMKEGTSEEIELLLRGRASDFNIVDYLNEAAVSSESVQTLTFKSTPAAFNRDNKDKIPLTRDRPVSLENIPSMRINDRLLRPPSRRKISKRLIDDKMKIYEFLMSLDSVKVEEYLQMLTTAGISRDVLQGLLQALQNKTPDSIPNEVLRYFDTDSNENQSSNLNRGDIFRGHVDETSLTNITSFATFSTYLSIAEDILNKSPNVSESEKKQVLEALRKQDSSMIPKTLSPKILQDIETAAASLLNDEQQQDTDTTSIIESEYLSGPEFKRVPSKDTRSNLLSPFGPRDSNQPSQNSTSRSPLNDSSQSRDNDQKGGSTHESKKSRIERLKQRSRTAGALDAFTTHSPMQSPIRPNPDLEDEIKESLINDENQLNQNPDLNFPGSFSNDSRRTSNTSEAMAEVIGKPSENDRGNRGTITSTPVDRELYRMSSDEALQDGSSPPTVLPVTGTDIANLPRDVRNKLAAQILINQKDGRSREQILSDAGASSDTAIIVNALSTGNGSESDIRDTIAQLLAEPIVQYILDISGPQKCQETLSKIPVPIIANEDTSCDNFSEEMKSDESVAKQLKAAQGHHVSAVIFLASHALMNLPKGERNYWLENLGLYDVIKDEIKDAIAKGDIEKLRKLLPEDCAKFLLQNLPGKKIKENISDILRQAESPLHQHLVKFVSQSLLEEPLGSTTEVLNTVLEDDEETESELLQAISDRNEARLQSLLTNEVIDAIIGEISSEVLIESLVNDDRIELEVDQYQNEPRRDLQRQVTSAKPSSKPYKSENEPKNSNQRNNRKYGKGPDQNMLEKNVKQDQRSLPGQSFLSNSGNKFMAEIESSEPYFDTATNATSDEDLENKEKSESDIQSEAGTAMMTPQRIVASLMLDWRGEQILEFISDFDNDRQNQILDAIIGGDIVKVASLIEKPMADKVLKEFNPFDIISVIEKAQERFKDPAKLLDPENLEETKDVLQTLVETFSNDKSSLKDVLARLDVDLATKIFDSLNTGDLVATKALLHSAAKASESSNLTKHHALSDSALARNNRPRKLSQTLFSKSESELAMKPQGSTTVSKEVLGDFYEEAQKLGSQSKIVYVNVPEPPLETDIVQPGETDEMLDLLEPADLDIPDELVDILAKYVHPDDVIGLYDAFLTNPELISENLPPEDVEKLYEEVKAYEDKRQQRIADLYNVAADTLKSLFPQEMDDLVEKMQQSMPEDVNTFCDHVKNGEFEQAARYLPKDILDEMMDHNQSLLAEQIGDPPRRLVPAIKEEDENMSEYGNCDPMTNPLGILKKEEPQNSSAKNLHQVKFASEVLEFNLTNPSLSETFESNNSSKDSLNEKQNDNLENEDNIEDGLNNALSDLEKHFDDIGERISALEARMSENDDTEKNDDINEDNGEPAEQLSQAEDVGLRPEIADKLSKVESQDVPASKERPWKRLLDRSPYKKLKPLDYNEIEDGDIIPEMRQRQGLEHIPTDLNTLFAPGKRNKGIPEQPSKGKEPSKKQPLGFPPDQDSQEASVDDDEEFAEEDSEKEQERGDLMKDIDKWQQDQKDPLQPSQQKTPKSAPAPKSHSGEPTSPSRLKPSKIPKLQSPRSPREKKLKKQVALPSDASPKLRKYNQLADEKLLTSPSKNGHQSSLDDKVTPDEVKSPPSKIPRKTSPRVPLEERVGQPLKRFDSKIEEDLVPSARTGQQEKENNKNFDELLENDDEKDPKRFDSNVDEDFIPSARTGQQEKENERNFADLFSDSDDNENVPKRLDSDIDEDLMKAVRTGQQQKENERNFNQLLKDKNKNDPKKFDSHMDEDMIPSVRTGQQQNENDRNFDELFNDNDDDNGPESFDSNVDEDVVPSARTGQQHKENNRNIDKLLDDGDEDDPKNLDPDIDEDMIPSVKTGQQEKENDRNFDELFRDDDENSPQKLISDIEEDTIPSVRTGQQHKENDRNFDELLDDSEENGSTTENEEIITSPTRDSAKPEQNQPKETKTPSTPTQVKDTSKKNSSVSEKVPHKKWGNNADKIKDSLPDKNEQDNDPKPSAPKEQTNKQFPIWRAPISGSPKRPDPTQNPRDSKDERRLAVNFGDSSSLELSLETEIIPRENQDQPREGSPTPRSSLEPEDTQKMGEPGQTKIPESDGRKQDSLGPKKLRDPSDQNLKQIHEETRPSSSLDSPRSIDSSIDLGRPDKKENLHSKPWLPDKNISSPDRPREILDKKLTPVSKKSKTEPEITATPTPVDNDKPTTQKVPPVKSRKPFLPPRQNQLTETPEPLQTSSPIQTPIDEKFLKPEQVEKPQSINKDPSKASKAFPWEPANRRDRTHQQISDDIIDPEERPNTYSAMPNSLSEPNKFFPQSETPVKQSNASGKPNRGAEPKHTQEPVEQFIDPGILRAIVADLLPKGHEPEDRGYIKVKEAELRVQAVAKPNIGENPKFSKPTTYKPNIEKLNVADNKPKIAKAITQIEPNPLNRKEFIEKPTNMLPVDEDEEFIPSNIQNLQEKEPDFDFMDPKKSSPGQKGNSEYPKNDQPTSNRPEIAPSSQDPDELYPPLGKFPGYYDWPVRPENEAPSALPYPVTLDSYPNQQFPTSTTPQIYPTGGTQPLVYEGYPPYPMVPQNQQTDYPEEEPIRTSSPHEVNSEPGATRPYDPSFRPSFAYPDYGNDAVIPPNIDEPIYSPQPYYGEQWPLTSNFRPIVPETKDRGSQVALDTAPHDASQLNKSPHQINLSIDVHVHNDNEPGRNNELNNVNENMPPYNTGNNTYQNAPLSDIGFISPITATKQAVSSTARKPRNKETQTADNETSNSSQISLNSSNNQNQSRDSNSMYLIEYRYLPGLRDDPTIEDLELKCSKALGEVNGLLSAVDQISPPSSPTSQPKFDHTRPKNNIVSISTVSRVRNHSYTRKSSDDLLEDSHGGELRPALPRRTGHRSLPRANLEELDPASRYHALYPNLNSSNQSDFDPQNYRSSQRLRLQNANKNSNLLRNSSLSNSLRNLSISANKALLDQQTGQNLYRQPELNLNSLENISSFHIPSQPAYNLTEFKFSNDDLDRNHLTCECPDENKPPLGNPRAFNTRPFQHTDSHTMSPHSNYNPNLYNDGHHPMYRYPLPTSKFNPDDAMCSCDDILSPSRYPNLYSTSRYNLPQNPYLNPNTRSPDYFVRSKLTKTPFYRQPNYYPGTGNDDNCCTCSDNEDGQHFPNCPLCVIENESLGHPGHNGTLIGDSYCTCEMDD